MQGEILLAFWSSRRRAGADGGCEVNQEPLQELLVADMEPAENGASATNPSRDIALSYLRLATSEAASVGGVVILGAVLIPRPVS
jgi:hypothetical protein